MIKERFLRAVLRIDGQIQMAAIHRFAEPEVVGLGPDRRRDVPLRGQGDDEPESDEQQRQISHAVSSSAAPAS